MYNKALDPASIDKLRKALAEVEVNESDRAKHYKGATPPEMMKDKLKGKGAEDMMKPAQDAIANPTLDEPNMVNKDAKKMTSNVKAAGGLPKKNSNKGDSKIVAPGTPMKDPAGKKVYEDVKSAAKKPENYIDDKGVQRTRNVASNRQVVKTGSHNESFVVPEEIDVKERTAFMGAAAAAHKAGKKTFPFGGKIHPVTIKKDTAAAVSDSTDPWADMDLDAIELDEDPFHDVPSRPQWITDAYDEIEERYSLAQKIAVSKFKPKGKPGSPADHNELAAVKRMGTKAYGKLQKDLKAIRNDPKKNWRLGGSGGDRRNPTGSMVGVRESNVKMAEKSSVNYKDIDGKTVNEISKDLAKSYMKGRSRDLYFTGKKAGQDDIRSMVGAPTPSYKKGPERRASKMMKGMDMAVNKLTGKAKVPAQGKTGRNVRDQY